MHVAQCIGNAKEKNLFRAGMNRRFRRENFVEKRPDVVINKTGFLMMTK